MAFLIESFWVCGANGRRYRANIYQDRISVSSFQERGSIGGLKTCQLEDGTHLNYVDENTFKNVATGELLKRCK